VTPGQRFAKRLFDLAVAAVGLLLGWWLLALGYVAASVSTGQSGLFRQRRVGRNGRLFTVVKLRSMRAPQAARGDQQGGTGTITAAGDPRITCTGALLRRTKLDELPQLLNVLVGDMSLVGPRPDVPGYADRLTGSDRVILSVRPGITGPATLKYRNEEELLAASDDPVRYNDQVIYPDKVRISREYVENHSFAGDLVYPWQTVTGRP
jgi:lipopolysaccharide/colanic/teichoic acid biosynthesis glycosyltransferase